MPSSYTSSLRLELQAAGENLNTWGAPKLNNVITRLDFSISGWTTIALTGNYTLTASNTSDDEARSAMLKFTGTGAFVVTVPSVSKSYVVYNACTSALTLTTGAGSTASVAAGEMVLVGCDGASVYKVKVTDFGNSKITSLGSPTADTDAATKKYVDDTAFAAISSGLPGQTGNSGKYLGTDGATASWSYVPQASVTGLTTALAALSSTDAANLATARQYAITYASALP